MGFSSDHAHREQGPRPSASLGSSLMPPSTVSEKNPQINESTSSKALSADASRAAENFSHPRKDLLGSSRPNLNRVTLTDIVEGRAYRLSLRSRCGSSSAATESRLRLLTKIVARCLNTVERPVSVHVTLFSTTRSSRTAPGRRRKTGAS